MTTARFPSRRPALLAVLAVLLFVVSGAGCQSSSSAAPPPRFDADRAYADLKKQVDFGPRVPGTAGHQQTRDWILAQLQPLTDKAFVQDFEQTIRGKTLKMSNIIGQFNPDAKRQVLLCAHWDTRPSADQEIDASRRKQPIPGANDGASGVAVLLELARLFHAARPEVGVELVFFDGEDYGPELDDMFLGARHYAKNLAAPKPEYAILIDMIGDRDLKIWRERNSEDFAPEINDKVWKAAANLKVEAFQFGVRHTISDDHLSLQEAGIKAIDLIDFDYAPWHTLDDTPDKTSAASLKAVGDVLAQVIYTEKNQ